MESTMTFEEKVKSMTGKEIVMAMVEGLQEPCTVIDMNTFGETKDGICFGCAATNTVCKITGIKPTKLSAMLEDWDADAEVFNIKDPHFLMNFEYAINKLRNGSINPEDWFGNSYNGYARLLGIAILPEPKGRLPHLNNENYLNELQAYINYANSLPDNGK